MTIRSVDDVDRSILTMLRANGRETSSAIARKVGLSRAAVHQRVARLERDGIITGYTALVYRPEGGAVTAIVMINLDAPKYGEVATELAGWPEVRACWSVAGERDMAILVDVDSNDALMDVNRRLNQLSAVRDTATHVALRTHFDRNP
jgi:Lrp/AsnC family transcriptional regulator, leucine-responsive regulatory protein